MKILSHFMFIILATIIATACSPQETATEVPVQPQTVTTFVTTGSGSVTAILSAIAEDFATDTPGYQIEVLTGSGTGGGITGITEKTLDIAAMARPPRDNEVEQGVQYFELGRGGVAFFVNQDVDVSNLTTEQVNGIYAGEIVNWSEVGGSNLAITAYTRDEGGSTMRQVREAVFGELEFPEAIQVMINQSDM